jgi:hydrogenase maturation protease
MLSSPIILYDYPRVADESPGDLFDCTEIDEILTLRILALSDAEKQEMRRSGERERLLLERAESLSPEQLLKLHGTMRDVRSGIRPGDRVRIRPKPGGDIFDVVLRDRIAIVESVEQDFENRVHVAVVVEDDPGKDLGLMRQPGHRFFFSADELELVSGTP